MNSSTPTTPAITPETKKTETNTFASFDKKAADTKTQHNAAKKPEKKTAVKPEVEPAMPLAEKKMN